jgi:hypothetical protein
VCTEIWTVKRRQIPKSHLSCLRSSPASPVWGPIHCHPSSSRPQLTRAHPILARAMFRTAVKATTPVVANARNVARRSVLRAVCPRPCPLLHAGQSIALHPSWHLN